MSSDGMLDFEADNYDDLVEKFLDIKAVRDMWENFVCDEYEDECSSHEPDFDMIIEEDKLKEEK